MSRSNLNQEKYGISIPENSAKEIVDTSIVQNDKFKSSYSLDEDMSSEKNVTNFRSNEGTFKILFFILLGILILISVVYLGSILSGDRQVGTQEYLTNMKKPQNDQSTSNDVQLDTEKTDQRINDRKIDENQQSKKQQNQKNLENNSKEETKKDIIEQKENQQNSFSNQNVNKKTQQNPKPKQSTQIQKQQRPKGDIKSKTKQITEKTKRQKTIIPDIYYKKAIQDTVKDGVPKFTVRQKPRADIMAGDDETDCYEFTDSIDNITRISGIHSTYKDHIVQWTGIKKSQYQRAIRLMQVVHNVNYKGEFVFDHFNFYPSPEAKAQALFKVLQEEKQYFDQKYDINKYIHDQIGICVYVPSYNNAKNRLYLRNLDSIFQQEYQNYHVVYVNDASTDGTGQYVESYMQENEIPNDKYIIINNDKNKEDTGNFYTVVRQNCKEGQIMIFLDGQDALIGRQVFSLLNAVYQKQKIALTYGQFLIVRENRIHSGLSRSFPIDTAEDGTFRKLRSFYTSHLKTAYVDVLRQIKKQDLQDEDGQFFEYGADVAIMTPAIELVGSRMKFLTQLNYEHRFDSGFHEPHEEQRQVQQEVFQKDSSQQIQDMSFADNPKTVHYE